MKKVIQHSLLAMVFLAISAGMLSGCALTRRSTVQAPTANSPVTSIPPIQATPNEKLRDAVQAIYQGINKRRREQQLSALSIDPTLSNIAQIRSNDMISRNYFSHNDPQTGQLLFESLLRQQRFAYFFAGENLAELQNEDPNVASELTVYARYSAPELANHFVVGWIKSTEHLENIENSNFRRTGIALGVSSDGRRVVATQVFSD